MTYLHAHRHLKASTIRTHLSSIAYHHQMSGMNSPTDSFIAAKLLASYEKQDTPPRVRKAITNPILKKLIKSVKAHPYDPHTKALYVCLFSLMYHALLRCSEISFSTLNSHNLTLSQIKLRKSSLRVTCSYKHSKAAPAPLKVSSTKDSACPVNACRKFLRLRGNKPGPLFCRGKNTPLKRNQIVCLLSRHLALLGLNPKKYNTHSFRYGKATDMAKNGSSHAQIALAGRWRSNAFLKYIKPAKVTI